MSASSLSGTQGIIAIAAAAVALLALIAVVWLAISLRRMRSRQRLVLGEHGERDLVSHAADLQSSFDLLREYIEDITERLDTRLAAIETSLMGKITHRALVRYDAYNELSGQQSMSIALLDENRSGIVLSCIHHRDQARVYAKELHLGESELELSPEESEAVRLAISPPKD